MDRILTCPYMSVCLYFYIQMCAFVHIYPCPDTDNFMICVIVF